MRERRCNERASIVCRLALGARAWRWRRCSALSGLIGIRRTRSESPEPATGERSGAVVGRRARTALSLASIHRSTPGCSRNGLRCGPGHLRRPAARLQDASNHGLAELSGCQRLVAVCGAPPAELPQPGTGWRPRSTVMRRVNQCRHGQAVGQRRMRAPAWLTTRAGMAMSRRPTVRATVS